MEKLPTYSNPWQTLSTEEIYDNPWIRVREHQVIHPGGTPGIYGVVDFKNLAIGVIPIDDEGYTWLVGQYRYPHEAYTWEIPEGGGPMDQTPLESAKRELREETGIVAEHWEEILQMDLSNSATSERAYLFIAKGLSFHESNPEDSEDLKVIRVHVDELIERVLSGELRDSLTVAATLKLYWMRQNGKVGT
ncbi:NUDIX hydrolase [bacterium SCSIO 12741]|nr:NUDIX hydrolase [bacterium SCSIO 12741]